MGLFDFLKKNKNIITDNGTNFIYYNEGKGKLKEKFNKLNGKLHGSYIKYDTRGSISHKEKYNNGQKVLSAKEKKEIEKYNIKWDSNRKFISNLIEIDKLFSKITGANLILPMLNDTLNIYAKLIEKKISKYYEGELLKVYLYYKRNFLINNFITSNINYELKESDLNILFTSHINEIKNEIEKELNNLPKNIVRFHYTPSRSLKESLINKIFSEKVTKNQLIFSFYEVQRFSSQKYFNLTPEEFSIKIFNQDSFLFGIKPDILLLVNKIISNVQDIEISNNRKLMTDSAEYKKFATSIGLSDHIDLFEDELKLFEKLLSNYLNEIKNIFNLNKVNQDEVLSEINKINFDDFEIKTTSNVNINLSAFEYFESGKSKELIKDFQGALKDYNKAIELDEDSEAYRYRAGIKSILNDFIGAMKDYNLAIEKHPNHRMTNYYRRGCLKIELEDLKGAIHDFDMSIDANINLNKRWPHYAFYKKRGDCKLKIKDYNGAIEDLYKAMELNPNCIEEVKVEIENIKKKIN